MLLCGVADNTGGQGCHPKQPGWAKEVGLCEPHEVQQGHVQGPAPGQGQSQTWIQIEALIDKDQHWKEGLGVLVDEILDMCQHCMLAAQKRKCILLYINGSVASRWREVILFLS